MPSDHDAAAREPSEAEVDVARALGDAANERDGGGSDG